MYHGQPASLHLDSSFLLCEEGLDFVENEVKSLHQTKLAGESLRLMGELIEPQTTYEKMERSLNSRDTQIAAYATRWKEIKRRDYTFAQNYGTETRAIWAQSAAEDQANVRSRGNTYIGDNTGNDFRLEMSVRDGERVNKSRGSHWTVGLATRDVNMFLKLHQTDQLVAGNPETLTKRRLAPPKKRNVSLHDRTEKGKIATRAFEMALRGEKITYEDLWKNLREKDRAQTGKVTVVEALRAMAASNVSENGLNCLFNCQVDVCNDGPEWKIVDYAEVLGPTHSKTVTDGGDGQKLESVSTVDTNGGHKLESVAAHDSIRRERRRLQAAQQVVARERGQGEGVSDATGAAREGTIITTAPNKDPERNSDAGSSIVSDGTSFAVCFKIMWDSQSSTVPDTLAAFEQQLREEYPGLHLSSTTLPKKQQGTRAHIWAYVKGLTGKEDPRVARLTTASKSNRGFRVSLYRKKQGNSKDKGRSDQAERERARSRSRSRDP